MGKIFFVRHAQSQFNAGSTEQFNSDLSPRGKDQAHRLALAGREKIGAKPESFIGIVSPYNRCLQTAYKFWTMNGVKFRVDTRIGESPEPVHKHQSTEIIKKACEYTLFDWSMFGNKNTINYDDESDADYGTRINDFIASLEKDKNYFIVSHMTPITHMVRQMCFGGRREPMTITNASMTLIEDGVPVYIGLES